MVQIPTKPAALKHVVTALIGDIRAGNVDLAAGLNEDTLTRAEMGRLVQAKEEVIRRLAKIGRQEPAE